MEEHCDTESFGSIEDGCGETKRDGSDDGKDSILSDAEDDEDREEEDDGGRENDGVDCGKALRSSGDG